MPEIVFVDSEISVTTQDICDLGAVKPDKTSFHSASQAEFSCFVSGAEYVCGHNIIGFDLKYVGRLITGSYTPIDTLYLSPLLFPNRPYHKLLKDDKACYYRHNQHTCDGGGVCSADDAYRCRGLQ